MSALKAIGGSIKNFMILFSFIVNLILVIVLIVLGLVIFEIKNQIATPLVSGLHSSFVGLDEATIDWTIPVRAEVPVQLQVPVQLDTTVVLTQAVPVTVTANITLPGVGELNNASVNLSLPQGLQLPVRLDFTLPLDERLPVELDVRAVIPLRETQLHDPFENLRLMFEPLAVALHNLPDGFDQVPAFAGDLLDADGVNLLAANEYSQDPWPGFSRTAGVGYSLGSVEWPTTNLPLETGIVALGGIPLLDQSLRPEIWAQGGPEAVNANANAGMASRGVPSWAYTGDTNSPIGIPRRQPVDVSTTAPDGTISEQPAMTGADMGIVPTPSVGG